MIPNNKINEDINNVAYIIQKLKTNKYQDREPYHDTYTDTDTHRHTYRQTYTLTQKHKHTYTIHTNI